MRAEIIVEGFVQGVAFRYFVQENAKKLGLKGYARNVGSDVKIVAEGKEGALRELVEACRKGPSYSRVRKVNVDYSEASNEFDSFSIRF